MKIVEFLSEKAVSADLKATTKDAALRELVDVLAKAEGIRNKEDLVKVLLNRESLGSTGIGQGVGIPHAKTNAVKKLVAALGISSSGVNFDALDGEPVQHIAPVSAAGIDWLEHDLSRHPRIEQERERLVAEEARAPFDLERGPTIRCRLIVEGPDAYTLLITMHHIVSDGWSMGVLVKELSALYAAYLQGAADPLPALPVQYADYAQWQREWLSGAELQRQSDYWKQALAGAPALCELPADRPVRLEVQASQFIAERTAGAVGRQLQQVRPNPLEQLALDTHLDMPAGKADRIPEELERHAAHIANAVALLLKERVLAVRGQQDEPPTKAQVLDARLPPALAAGPAPLRLIDSVPLDELGVDQLRPLAFRDQADDIEVVAVRHVRDGQLLDEPSRARAFIPVHAGHVPRPGISAKRRVGKEVGCLTRSEAGAAQPTKPVPS